MARVTSAFEDAGFEVGEVAVLETKVRLMVALNDIIDGSGMTRAQAAKRFGVMQRQVHDLRQHIGDKFSVDALIAMLARTGRSVTVSVRRR
jgi:predicted XRE-type DNA-binding protein